MNQRWLDNIQKHRKTIAAVAEDLEGRYSSLGNESDDYNEAMNQTIHDLCNAHDALSRALDAVRK